MLKNITASLVFSGLMLATSGCNKSSEGGSSGTANSFKVSAPTLPTSLKQGEKQTVKLTLDRGSDLSRLCHSKPMRRLV